MPNYATNQMYLKVLYNLYSISIFFIWNLQDFLILFMWSWMTEKHNQFI